MGFSEFPSRRLPGLDWHSHSVPVGEVAHGCVLGSSSLKATRRLAEIRPRLVEASPALTWDKVTWWEGFPCVVVGELHVFSPWHELIGVICIVNAASVYAERFLSEGCLLNKSEWALQPGRWAFGYKLFLKGSEEILLPREEARDPSLPPELDGKAANSNFMLSMFGSEIALSA